MPHLTKKESCSLQSPPTCPPCRHNPKPFAGGAKLSVVMRVGQGSGIGFHPSRTSEPARGAPCGRRWWCYWSRETWSQMQGPLGISYTLAQVKILSEVALARGAGHNTLTGRTRVTGSTTVSKSKSGGEGIRLDGKTTLACIAVQACFLLPAYGEDMMTS